MSERILIVGATSAIAQEMAHRYAHRGARLFLVGRNAAKLGRLAEELGAAVLGMRTVDLTQIDTAEDLVAEAWTAGGGLDIACIAHGWLGDQKQTERDMTEAAQVIVTNFLSVVALLVPLANRFEQARAGHIGVLSSVAGDRGRPRNYTYGAAKGALAVYLQGMRTRLWRAGVRVSTLKLGPVDTPMTATHRKHALFAQAKDIAAGAVAAIDAGKSVAYLPWFWRPIMFGVRNMPEPLIQRLGFLSGR